MRRTFGVVCSLLVWLALGEADPSYAAAERAKPDKYKQHCENLRMRSDEIWPEGRMEDCRQMAICRGFKEASRCYCGASCEGAPLFREVWIVGGRADGAIGEFSVEQPVDACFSLAGGVRFEELSPGVADPVPPTTSKQALVLGQQAVPGSDEVSFGAVGVSGRAFLYGGIFVSAAVMSYADQERSLELGDLALRLGAGRQRILKDRWLYRMELGYRFFDDLDLDGLEASFGVGYRFGKKKSRTPRPESEVTGSEENAPVE